MKIWVDDVRHAPEGYFWCKTVDEAISRISLAMKFKNLEIISLDHDSGTATEHFCGKDFIMILNQMEYWQHGGIYDFSNIPIHIHSANPVGVANMRRIIEKNGWTEVK